MGPKLFKRCNTVSYYERNLNAFSIVEAAVGAAILAIVTGVSISLFNQYTNSSSKARIRDELSSIVTRDSERLRNTAATLWPCTSNCPSGTLAFNPPSASCNSRQLASAAASANNVFAAGTTSLVIPVESSPSARSALISRLISHQGNLIVIRYTSSNPVTIDYISYILPPAQGWCP